MLAQSLSTNSTGYLALSFLGGAVVPTSSDLLVLETDIDEAKEKITGCWEPRLLLISTCAI